MSESNFIGHEPCPKCGSSDALSRYDDGHGYCHACETYFPGEGDSTPRTKGKKMAGDVLAVSDYDGEYREMVKRGISEETCKKFGYMVGKYKGKAVQVANYRNAEGDLIAQKIRFPDKEFMAKGNMKEAPLYGRSSNASASSIAGNRSRCAASAEADNVVVSTCSRPCASTCARPR